jgi:hypothetical protein
MKLVRIMAIAALAAGVSTAAQAGGYSFQSIGGNLGKWAYGDAAAHGDAQVYGYDNGYTYSGSDASTETKKETEIKGNCGYCGSGEVKVEKKTTSDSYAYNEAGFSTYYGEGSAQSHSGAVAGSGVGAGIGFKAGNFEPKARRMKMDHRH